MLDTFTQNIALPGFYWACAQIWRTQCHRAVRSGLSLHHEYSSRISTETRLIYELQVLVCLGFALSSWYKVQHTRPVHQWFQTTYLSASRGLGPITAAQAERLVTLLPLHSRVTFTYCHSDRPIWLTWTMGGQSTYHHEQSPHNFC